MHERGTMRGTLIWFNPEKRMGYIRTEDGERLLTFEREAADVEGGFRAVRVATLTDEAPNRARRRHR